MSKWRITKPHKILFILIKNIDFDAQIEFRVKNENKWHSYDIYSPKINSLIEMHGRFWHDLNSIETCRNLKIKEIIKRKC